MTSPANQQIPISATTTSATLAASYASAAGAPKKTVPQVPAPTPAVVIGPSSSAPAQNANAAPSPSPVNGKAAVPPAVPAVPVVSAVSRASSSSINGSDHSRKSSVTMAANGPSGFVPNGGSFVGAKSGIQFGYDSPAMAHSTPQAGHSAPIPIPGGNQRVPSPAHSPSPIPQPSASGGRPPSGLQQPGAQMTFGSLNSDGDRHMRQGSGPSNPNALTSQSGAHFRRESSHSVQSDNPGGPGRGNFGPPRGQSRGTFNPHANQFSNQMGYPPNNHNLNHSHNHNHTHNQFRNGPNQRQTMPPAFQPQSRTMPYPNSPQPNRSPALVPSMPNTPSMPPASVQPAMSIQTPPQYPYPPPPPMASQHQQVQFPFPAALHNKSFIKSFKNNSKGRREHDRPFHSGRQLDPARELYQSDSSQPQRRHNQREDKPWREQNVNSMRAVSIGALQPAPDAQAQHINPVPDPSATSPSFDLSPESGGFERWLTLKNQTYGYPPQQVDQYGRPLAVPYNAFGNVPYMPPQTNSPGYGAQFVPPPFHQQAHPMTRTSSQPERPPSASQSHQPVIVSSGPQAPAAQSKPSSSFIKPKRNAAVQIKNPAGEVVDTSTFKQPVSPAPSSQQTRTPPVVSTPTPPHKPSTPSHARSESQATQKTAKEIQDELKAKIKQNIASEKTKEEVKKDDEKKKKEEEEEEEEEQEEETKPEEPVVALVNPEIKVEDEKEPEQKPEPVEEKVEVENKPAAGEETPVVEKTETETVKVEEPKEIEEPKEVEEPKEAEVAEPSEPETAPASASAPAPAAAAEPEEDEIERMIREMEEADARREKEEEEHRKKKEAEKAAAKKLEEENRKKNAEEEDRKLREQEREMERLEEEKERRQRTAEASGTKVLSVAEALAQLQRGDLSGKDDSSNVESVADKMAGLSVGDKSDAASKDKRTPKPAALNLAPINTKPVEPPQPSAALQSLKSARFLQVMEQDIYPAGIKSPNPALNAAVAKKGKTFKYDAGFLLQFKEVFTEQPSLQFQQTIKNLIGDSDGGRSASRGQTPTARQGSRGGGFPGGALGGPVGRTLPPGTTSMERMAFSNGVLPRPQVNPMASFQRPGGAFPGATPMSRTSSQNLRNVPHSPRANSRSTRGSRRNDINAKEAQAAKTMPLTAGQEVKPIAVTANGWKATSLSTRSGPQAGAPAGASGQAYLDPEMVQRKVKAALNKMTPEKFDKIADQILLIASQSKDESDGRTLRQVIQLTFEKATDEAHWASMYAKFCKRMLETMSADIRDERIKDKNGNVVSGGNLFRKYLLNRCQEEFERGWTTNLPEPKELEEGESKKTGDAAMLTDEYYAAAAAKRRGLGLVQFIGELFKLGMLTERIMHECVQKLVDYKGVPDEAEIESLCKLLRTIGANLDETEKGRPLMDAYFQRIQTMVELPELQSRIKFMLMDVLDLRRARWVSKEANKGPKTLEEVRAEAEAAQVAKAQEAAKSNQRGGGGGRPLPGRGDARNFAQGFVQQTSTQVGLDDLRRLKGNAPRTSSHTVTLGPTSMLTSRSNSGRRAVPGGSLRPGDDSNSSSRTGTPGPAHQNAFSLLAMDDHIGSPPGPSPLLEKAVPASSEKKDNE